MKQDRSTTPWKILCLLLFLTLAGVLLGFLLTGSSNGSCNTASDYTSDHTSDCQSDTACVSDASSCPESDPNCVSQKVPKLPEGNCSDLAKLTQLLWESDQDRLSTDEARVNFQAQLEDKGTVTDKSPDKFFTYVNASQLEGSVYTTFLAMIDNYNPVKNEPEVVTPEKEAEEERFLNVILATPTMEILTEYLVCRGKVRDVADLKATLKRLWFELYPRSGKSTVLDTSGFEHVMVGEFKSAGSVNGLHSWLSFYEKEQNGTLNYYGHTCSVHNNTVCAAFEWDERIKRKASLFLRTSPAYDIAIYSLCFILYPGGMCPVVVDGTAMDVRTYSKDGHIATAFVVE